MNASPLPTLNRIILETPGVALGYDIAADLEQRGLAPVEVRPAGDNVAGVLHGPGTSAALITRLLEALRPLSPEHVSPEEALAPGEIVVRLAEIPAVTVDLRADSLALLAKLALLVEQLGWRVGERHLEVQDHNRLHHTAAPLAVRQVVRWALARRGLIIEEQDHAAASPGGEGRDRIELRLRDPEMTGRPFGDRFGVQILTDDYDAGEELAARLRQDGFASCQVILQEDDSDEPRFRLHPGPFSSQRTPGELVKLRAAIEQSIKTAGLDPVRFPVMTSRTDQGMAARIELPLMRFRQPHARAYAGAFPDRFDVVVHTDDVHAAGPLADALRRAGYVGIEFQEVASMLESPLAEQPAGLVVRWSAAAREKTVAAAFKSAVEDAMKQLGGSMTLESVEQPGSGVAIHLYFPIKGVADGRLAAYLADPRRYHIKIAGAEGGEWADLKTQLEAIGFTVHDASEGGLRPRGRLEYGAAPPAVVERVQDLIKSLTGSPFPARRVIGGDELVLSINLPRRVKKPAQPTANAQEPVIDIAGWLGEVEAGPPRAFIEASAHEVRIGHVRLPRRPTSGPFVPSPSSFEHFCLDAVTTATLEHLAAGVLLREPCLLEGETSTSKTTAVLYLAALMRQPVVRINLNGQTDTGELIGRFVPRDSDRQEEPSSEWDTADDLQQKAHLGGSLWRWQDGLVVQAMRKGWWVLLDEVNLAEPQILERLNSVLEVEPSLILTEYDNSPVDPVHPSFRLFATMNPAEYAGRSVLSPAYRDRWRGYRYVPRPGEGEYVAMLRLLVHGEQPGVMVQGRRYSASRTPARFASLTSALTSELLVSLGRFQTSLEHAAGRGGDTPRLGGRRKERHVFSRRGLLSVLDFLASPLGVGTTNAGPRAVKSALARYYLGRVADPHDQALVMQLLDAAGLGRTVAKK